MVRNHFSAITGAEESKQFQVFMAPVPWIELYAHLADPNDRAFDTCLKAVVASYIHTRIDGRFPRPKLMPQYLMVVAQALFAYQDEAENVVLFGLDEMAAQINASPGTETIMINKKYLEGIRDFGIQKKQEFASTFQHLQGEFHSLADLDRTDVKDRVGKVDFFFAWISALFMQAAEIAKCDVKALTRDEVLSKTEIIARYFAAPCYLAKHIMTQMVTNKNFNIERKNRRNWYWDYQMLFYISSSNALFLVTDDGDMYDAAVAAGIGDRILKLEVYMNMLQLRIPFSK